MTVLFADVVESTAMTARIGPEDWTAVMNRAYERLSPVIERYGGTIARLTGDGLLAFFGAPRVHEDDPLRAIHAGLALIGETRAVALEVDQRFGIQFAMRVGVSSGSVVLGDVGSDLMYEYTAMGDAVNLASRMQAAARPNTVLMTAETHLRVASSFDVIDRGPLAVKGSPQPVRAYEVRTRRVAAPPNASREHQRLSSPPLVGRQAEVGVLNATLDRLMQGEGGIAVIGGEAGLGKTRLLFEMRRSVADKSVIWLEAPAVAVGQSMSYWPFVAMLRKFAGIVEGCPEEEGWTRLQAAVGDVLGAETSGVLPYLATLLGLRVPGALTERVRYLDGDATGRQIFRAVRRFVERLAARQPVVMVFEDAHWMDRSSTRLLEHLLPLTRDVALLVCAASRPDHGSPAGGLNQAVAQRFADRYTRVCLQPLTGTDAAQIVATLPGVSALSAAMREQIVEKTEGNPFFAEEVVRSLVERRAASAHNDLQEFDIPDTIQGVIAARIDRLDDRSREVLKIAAVIGRTFHRRVLGALLGDDLLECRLDTLERANLIRAVALGSEAVYSFNHALTQETAYASILLRQRRDLHRRVAASIEALFGERLDEFYGRLAYHYAAAADLERAQEYLFKAGDQANAVAADSEAVTHYRQALGMWEQVVGNRLGGVHRASLHRKIGEALFRRGDYQPARRHLERALAELGHPLPRSRWRIRLIIARESARQIWQSFLPPARRTTCEAIDAAAEECVQAYRPLCWMDAWSNRERFLLEALLVLRRCQAGYHLVGEVQALSALAMICDFQGVFWLAERFAARAVDLADQIGHPIALGTAYGARAHHHHTRGVSGKALADYGRAMVAFQQAGDVRGIGAAGNGRAMVLIQRGELDAALRQSEETLRLGDEAGDPHVQGWGHRSLAEACLHSGRLHAAEAHLLRARQQLSDVQDQVGVVCTLELLRRCRLLLEGRADAARPEPGRPLQGQ